ncbi:MAG: ABC transporter ATP-binding protein [Desulfobacterales bacterium]|nr:ABC transporter ATP-binding protein [Desulfobacterales bacterium]MBF0395783.1 ABC transporter ATP-binding protein [Desulfobacterales bacterium]
MIELRNVSKIYLHGSSEVSALKDVSISIKKGEFLTIMGPSGSGKSTLLNLVGGLDQPSIGEIFIDDKPIHNISDDELTLIRRRSVGFIFQFFNLLPILTAVENVSLPLMLEGISFTKIKPKAKELLGKVGLEKRSEHRPEQLSGGEMQRVAIARALITNPAVLLADEPTGNLDSKTSEEILSLLKYLNGQGQTIVMVTHDLKASTYGTRIIKLKDGALSEDISIGGNGK